MALTTTMCRFLLAALLLVILVVLPGYGAPGRTKSKGYSRSVPQTVYDQKQTGDYNIQLHLKDFQIIALLGDDALGGDYDYNYDYSDFTLKPSTTKPTTSSLKPQTQPSTSSTPPKPVLTSKPTNVISPSTSPPKELLATIQKEPLTNNSSKQPPQQQASSNTTEGTSSPINSTKVVEVIESSTIKLSTEKVEETNSPGKIKVQIIETPVGIVPGEVSEDGTISQGEILHHRRCAQGFTRDKRGRCRRVRRPGAISPQLPYGFSRLANNLASRLRYSSSEESLPSSESSED